MANARPAASVNSHVTEGLKPMNTKTTKKPVKKDNRKPKNVTKVNDKMKVYDW